jgi:hypothetical protein
VRGSCSVLISERHGVLGLLRALRGPGDVAQRHSLCKAGEVGSHGDQCLPQCPPGRRTLRHTHPLLSASAGQGFSARVGSHRVRPVGGTYAMQWFGKLRGRETTHLAMECPRKRPASDKRGRRGAGFASVLSRPTRGPALIDATLPCATLKTIVRPYPDRCSRLLRVVAWSLVVTRSL